MSAAAVVSLLWSHGHGVMEAFVRRQPGTVVIAARAYWGENAGQGVVAAGGRIEWLEDLIDAERRRALEQEIAARRDGLAAALRDPQWQRHWLGGPIPPQQLAECLFDEASVQLPQMLLVVAALAEAARRYNVRLLVVNEDLRALPRLAVLWARQAGVPSLHLSHSVLLNEPYTVHGRVYADVTAVFGERGLEGYRDIGIDTSTMQVTGNPAWDGYADLRRRRPEIRAAVLAAHGLAAERPLVVFGTTWAANLSALGDEGLYGKTLGVFLRACKRLLDQGVALQAVVKDRPQNGEFGPARLAALTAEAGLAPGSVAFAVDDAGPWVAAADLLVSVDSNLSIEAMLAGVPAINLTSEGGTYLGPSFAADCGVADVADADDLAAAMAALLLDPAWRQQQLEAMARAAPSHNAGVDGRATERVVALMEKTARPDKPRYIWQTLLEVQSADATQYHNWAQSHLFELFAHAPRRVLDIGCGAGGTGAALKAAYAGAEVWGIEVNRAAAEVAATRIDHALAGKFEDVDLDAAGITPGSLDTVIVADVLEHMYDPWGVMVRLKPYLSPDAQVIASIPNIRNLIVMSELAKGNWHYDEFGLLDITHIRFFTLREVKRFFHETGYRVSELRYNIDGRLAEYFSRHRNESKLTVEFDRLCLKDVSAEEFGELCSLQFHVRAEPGSVAEAEFVQQTVPARPDYSIWRALRQLTGEEGRLWEARLAAWPAPPRLHLAVVVTERTLAGLPATLNSLTGQLYGHLRVSVVADAAAPAGWQDNERLTWRNTGGELIAAVNAVLLETPADWVATVDAGDELPPHACLFIADAAVRRPEWQVIYSDEDAVNAAGEHKQPHFKPDFNPELLRSYPYLGGLLLLRQPLLAELGGFAAACAGIEDYDLALRAWERVGDGAIGHIADVLLHRREDGGHGDVALPELVERGRRAVTAHLERCGLDAEAVPGYLPLSWRVAYRHPRRPQVSVIMALRDDLARLQVSIEALLANTSYPDFELLLVDAGSREAATAEYLAGLEALGDARLRVYRADQPAALAALHNLAAAEAGGELLLFLHYDALTLAGDWLDILVNHALAEGCGAVGPRLLAHGGLVRRTGLILGIGGGAESAFAGQKLDDPGYFGRALLEQRVSAIGGGAFLTPRAVFERLGGFDAGLGADAAEVDYCLRMAEQGLHAVWTPHASLICEGAAAKTEWSGSASPALAEQLQPRWLARLATDPAYNRNLRKAAGGAFDLEIRAALVWDALPWKPLPRILAQPADNAGCGQYRIFGPLRSLVAGGKVQGWVDNNLYQPVELAALDLDAVVFQRQITDPQIAALEAHRRYTQAFKVFELDDLLIRLPNRSAHRGDMPVDIGERLARAVRLCDRFVVSTEPLAEAYRNLHGDIRVVPNYLERCRWGGLKPRRAQSERPRVGWVGGAGHTGDLEMIADVVRELAGEVDWVFMGMCPDVFRPFVREFHEGVPFESYPAKVAALNLDLALAPLESNPFNEAKSHLRILEYGVLGYPVVCSDIFPYQGDFPVTRVKNRTSDWVRAIRDKLADMDALAREGDALRQRIEADWMLEDHLDVWLKAWLP